VPAAVDSIQITSTSTPAGPTAFAIFRAPADFARPGFHDDPSRDARVVFIEVRPLAMGVPRMVPILIKRPPVLFVHGLLSNPGTWLSFCPQAANGSECSLLLNSTFTNYFIDYRTTNDQSFIDNAPTAFRQMLQQLSDFKRSQGLAAVQFDIVAH